MENLIMSKPIAIVQSTSATLPPAGRKLITCVDSVGILGCILPPEIGRDDVIRARNVKLSYEMAHSAITGRKSPVAFVQALAFCAVVFSHGNKSLAQLQSGAPTWVQKLLENITQHFKCGAGTVTRSSLETALDAGIKLTLALPAPEKAVKDTTNGKVITSTTVGVDDDLTENHIYCINMWADSADKRAEDNLMQATQAHVDAMTENEAKARLTAESQKQQDCVDVARLIADMADKDQAVTLIRAMAAHFGFTLVDMQLPTRVAA